MKAWTRICALGLVVGAAGILLSPLCASLEESLGLALLFNLRGKRAAPADVCLVRMDRASARALELPADPSRWPRNVHARLVSRLEACNPAAIVFDVFFTETRGEGEDAALEAALAATSNVVLCAFSDLERLPLGAGKRAVVERIALPLDRFARRAAAVAPFPLPKVPAQVSRFWTFRDDADHIPSLPVAGLLCYLRTRDPEVWHRCLETLPLPGEAARPDASLVAASSWMRRVLCTNRSAADRAVAVLRAEASPRQRERIQCVFDLHAGSDSRLLNFYGPQSTIPSLAYCDVVGDGSPAAGDLAAAFAGKAVFVGFSDPDVPSRKDGFETVFSSRDGQTLSGTEIAATAFANLLDGSALRPVSSGGVALIGAGWGFLLGTVCRALPTMPSAAAALLGGGAYIAVAVTLFTRTYLWPPVVVPALALPATAFVCALLDRHALAARERRQMQETAGLYLPAAVVSRLTDRARDMGGDQNVVQGTCMITDAANYTPLSESMEPGELGRFMNRYFETAFRPVREQGGIVMNLTGDSILAVWLATPPAVGPSPRVCLAALDVVAGIRQFNRDTPQARLPTRIGVHHGPILLGSMGALDHFEYVPIGDTVNTAARLEALNKRLKTEVLVSADALQSVPGFVTRRLGAFRFAGKSRPLDVFELLGRDAEANPETRHLSEVFEEGLGSFAAGAWDQAAAHFRRVLELKRDDGPSAFFLELCAAYAAKAPEQWDGVVAVGKE